MCQDHAQYGQPATGKSALSRRRFLQGSAVLTAGGALTAGALLRGRLWSSARPVSPDGTSAYSMAMHVHSSFSEESASMDAQLVQATANSVDVLWWTDHDFRMGGIGFRDTVHFTSLTRENGGPGQGSAWDWQVQRAGPLTPGSGGGIVSSPVTPNDPSPHGSLSVTAKTQSHGRPASYGYYANSLGAGYNYRDNLTGQSLSVDVLLNRGWENGYLEMQVTSSYHEATAGRPAGLYSLSYRFVPSHRRRRVARQNEGIIYVPVRPAHPGGWATVTVTPSDDIAALWPDLDHRDFALYRLSLRAVSTGDKVSGYFDYLRFKRTMSGGEFFAQQADMMTSLAKKHRSVSQLQGTEVSWGTPHLNWFGGNVVLPSYGTGNSPPKPRATDLKNTVIPQIHKAGGLVSYNHPYGTSQSSLHPKAKQESLMTRIAASLLPGASGVGALGADLLEVGYVSRGGVDLAHHVGLWDVMSRNAVFLTGNGTNDDHFGMDWHGLVNNWTTSAWASSRAQADLLSAMTEGRCWCGSLDGFGGGTLDLLVDGSHWMGSATRSRVNSRQLTVMASGIPKNGSLRVVQGAVDYAGTADPKPNTKVIASYPAGQLASGQASLAVDTSAESFVRTEVLDAKGDIVALSNPAWLLRKTPPHGIPGPRAT